MWRKIVLWFKNVFGFSQKEINGFLILSFIMILCLILPFFFFKSTNYLNSNEDIRLRDSLLLQINTHREVVVSKKKSTITVSKSSLFKFDPNTLSQEEFEKLGLSKKIAKRIKNYTSNGGRFKVKSDLKKIYGLSEQTYELLDPFILLPEKIDNSKGNINASAKRTEITSYKKSDSQKLFIKINTCSAEDLQEIKGIGIKLSERIIKYRNSLGGFFDKKQYTEVFGLDSIVIQKLIESTVLESNEITKIYINQIVEDSLSKHPYVSYKLAKTIVNYRTQHGAFTKSDDLKNIKSLDEKSYLKIAPYFNFEK